MTDTTKPEPYMPYWLSKQAKVEEPIEPDPWLEGIAKRWPGITADAEPKMDGECLVVNGDQMHTAKVTTELLNWIEMQMGTNFHKASKASHVVLMEVATPAMMMVINSHFRKRYPTTSVKFYHNEDETIIRFEFQE